MLDLLKQFEQITKQQKINTETLLLNNNKINVKPFNEKIYELIFFVYRFSIQQNCKFYISVNDKFLHYFLKLKNCEMFYNDEQLLNVIDENSIIFYTNISTQFFEEINLKKFSLLVFNNFEIQDSETVTLTDNVIEYNNIQKQYAKILRRDFQFSVRTLAEQFNTSYVCNFGTPREKLLLRYNDFVENGKIKRGKLDECILFIFGKKKNSALYIELNDLISEVSLLFS